MSNKRSSAVPITGAAMPKMLFPTRKRSREANNGQPKDAPIVSPIAANPLKWIEAISASAEKQDSLINRGRAVVPIRVNGVSLSFKHPALAKRESKRQESPPSESYSLKEEGQLKRVRVADEGQDANSTQQPFPARLKEDNSAWDLSNLIEDSSQPTNLVQRIQQLATTAETMEEMGPSTKASYNRIRGHFALTLQKIVAIEASNEGGSSSAQTTAMVEDLYSETILKMEVLVQMMLELKATPNAAAAAPVPASPVTSTTEEAAPNSAVAKKNFAKYMTQWLRNNWTNPYPDDEGLTKMASDCATTCTIVGNWLINARTRKWRPAIVKAYENGRPAEMLLEDSINIFDNKTLRELETTSHEPLSEFPVPSHYPSNKRAKYA